MSFEIGSSSTITKRHVTRYGTHESEDQPEFEDDGLVKSEVKKKKKTRMVMRNKVMGSAPEARTPTLEKRPGYMIGTINFMGFVFVFFTLNEITSTYYSKGYFVDWTLFYDLIRGWDISLLLWAFLVTCGCLVWTITNVTIKRKIPYALGATLFGITLATMFFLPLVISFVNNFSYLIAGATSLQTVVHCMKIYSFWCTNWLIEEGMDHVVNSTHEKESQGGERVKNPKHLSFSHFIFYISSPNLIFETKWPRTDKIRWGYAAFLFVQMWCVFFILYLLLNNYLVPVYNNILNRNIFLSLLNLSLPSVGVWMLGFYVVFHCILGLFAELTRLADREFYHDWWNAENFEVWWRQWNRPVHKWMARHIYHESIERVKLTRKKAMAITFITSAILHEVIVWTAFKKFRPVLSTLMILQIGVIEFSKLKIFGEDSSFGNIVMWVTMFVGFPICEALYAIGFKY